MLLVDDVVDVQVLQLLGGLLVSLLLGDLSVVGVDPLLHGQDPLVVATALGEVAEPVDWRGLPLGELLL